MQDVYSDDSIHNLEIIATLEWYAERVIHLSKPGSLLELGIGFGETTRIFSKYFHPHTVVDYSQDIIEKFLKTNINSKVNIIQSTFEHFYPKSQYDTIVMGFILEHVDDPIMILKRYAQFLAPSGQLFVTIPNARSLHRIIGNAASIIDDVYILSNFDIKAGHQRYYDYQSMKKLILDCGYYITTTEGIMLKPITSEQMQTLLFDKKMFRALCKVGIEYPEICNSILYCAKLANNF